MPSVLVLGSNGMLGSALTRYLSTTGLRIVEVNRNGLSIYPGNRVHVFDVLNGDLREFLLNIEKPDFIINCVGVIKQKIEANSFADQRKAITINGLFPVELAEICESYGSKIIQIATDCVFSGSRGGYSEEDERDPIDVYGYSKAIGEINGKNLMTIRCSIIGNELNSSSSLLSWVLSQSKNSVLNGFTNHYWNGVTTLHFAKICEAIIFNEMFEAKTLHLIPADAVTKYELVESISLEFGRSDIVVRKHSAEVPIDRTLATIFGQINEAIWEQAGYKSPPTVRQMIQEYANWTYNA